MKYLGILMLVVASRVALAGALGPVSGEDTTIVAKKPLRYFFNISSGMLICSDCKLEGSAVAQPSTVHGIEYKMLRFGAGVGFNTLGDVRTLPYFGHVSLNLFGQKKRQGLIFEFNYGSTYAWTAKNQGGWETIASVRATQFIQPSFGYGFYYHKMRIALQVGWQHLDLVRKIQYGQGGIWDSTYYPPSYQETEYRLKRMFINLSLGI